MLVCNHGDYPFEELRFCIFYANENKKKRLIAATYEQNIEARFWIFEIFRSRIHQL